MKPKVPESREESEGIAAEKAAATDPVSAVIGCLKLDRATDDLVAELRRGR